MFKRRTLVVRQKLSSVVRGYWSITRVWKMAGRRDRFGSSEIIIIFGECLEGGALKSPFAKPDNVMPNSQLRFAGVTKKGDFFNFVLFPFQ